jgi:chromate transporter
MTESRVPLRHIALSFNRIALSSFGGGLGAWSRQVVVEERGWMSEAEFLTALTICRVLPGANQVNLAVFVGTKLGGVAGAVAAIVGLILVPALLILAVGALYAAHRHEPAVQGVLRGMIAAAVALSLSMAYKTGRACLDSLPAWVLFVAALLGAGVLRIPLLLLLAPLAALAMWWAWPRRVLP